MVDLSVQQLLIAPSNDVSYGYLLDLRILLTPVVMMS
jgi:hypothetical protein